MTSLFFDIGVYVLVVGLVLDLLRSLGSASTGRSCARSEIAPRGAPPGRS